MNKEKKPFLMALFLLGGLVGGNFFVAHKESGVLGGPGPLPASNVHIILDELGILYSQNMRQDAEPKLSFMDSPVLSGAIVATAPQTQSTPPFPDNTNDAFQRAKLLPLIKGYFALPSAGLNWGKLHGENAIDISNACGTPVYSSAEGVVIPDTSILDSENGWNNGYGTFVLLEHPNGVKTRYAHLSQVFVKAGAYVSKKQKIGLMGNTGRIEDLNGCHLHFEVLGAKNPFAKN